MKCLILAIVCATTIMAGEEDTILYPKKAELKDPYGSQAVISFQISMIKKSLIESKGIDDEIKQDLANLDHLQKLQETK